MEIRNPSNDVVTEDITTLMMDVKKLVAAGANAPYITVGAKLNVILHGLEDEQLPVPVRDFTCTLPTIASFLSMYFVNMGESPIAYKIDTYLLCTRCNRYSII